MNSLRWIEAAVGDEAVVLALMETFYREERLVFSKTEARAAVVQLLAGPELGRVFLLKEEQGGGHGNRPSTMDQPTGPQVAHGHLVLTFGFSLEFRGRYVLLDEVFVCGAMRGQGYGKAAVEFATCWAREKGVAALRLEVNRTNRRAREVYLRRGFEDDERYLLTKRLHH